MSQPNLPPYLGSWDELIKALLLNPFLGSGGSPHGPHPPQTHHERSDPQPSPWSPAANLILLTAAIRDIASHLPDSQKPLAGALSAVATDWEDGICPPPLPHPHVVAAAVEVMALASTLEKGGLRSALVREAGIILQKSFEAVEEKAAAVTAIA